MKKNQYAVWLSIMVGSWAGFSMAQIVSLDAPVANLTEKWSANDQGWTVVDKDWRTGDPICGWTNQTVVFECKVRNPVTDFMPRSYSVTGGTNASSGYYVGNFGKIDAVAFDAVPTSFSLNPSFYFVTRSGTIWSIPIGAALNGRTNGAAVNVIVPLTFSPSWSSSYTCDNYTPEQQASFFAEHKADVIEVGIKFVRGTAPAELGAQQLSVDNFKLVGEWGGPFTNGVPLAWLLETGLPTDDLSTIATNDIDRDGFNNLQEFLAGTDPGNAASFFVISIQRDENGKMVLKWKNNKYVNYSISESSDLKSFTKTVSNIQSAASDVVIDVADQGAGTRFYKVGISPKN